MVEKHDDVMKAVEDALTKDPDADLQTLFDAARSVDPSVEELTMRQFNARYPLQVKRKRSGARPGRKPAQGGPRTRRTKRQTRNRSEELRKLFYAFAQDLAEAGNKSEVVGALAKVEQYAQRVEDLFPKR